MLASNTVSHEIADVLRDEILRGQYRSGERLPSERDLASRFDASRGAVREALTQLEQIGIIEIQPGGARAQAIEDASIALLGPLMALDGQPNLLLVDQFLQTFAALASLTAREAVSKASDEQLIQLNEMVVILSTHVNDFVNVQPLWREFLDQLAEIADNLVVKLISNDLKAQFVEQMMSLGMTPRFDSAGLSLLFNKLSKSLRDRDSDLAGHAMSEHFDSMRDELEQALTTKRSNETRSAVA